MRILFFIDSLGIGGKERRFLSLIKGLLIKGYSIEIIILSEKIEYNIDLPVQMHFLNRTIKQDLHLIKKFSKILDSFKPDLVHGWDNLGSVQFAPFCWLKGIPFINSSISAAPSKLSYFSKRYLATAFAYPFSSVILANSHAGLQSFRVPKRKAKFIHNGFDISRLSNIENPSAVKKKYNLSTDKIVGMTATFSTMKDYSTFVKAGEELLKKRNDITFIALGDGPNFTKIKNQVSASFKERFLFLGKQSDVDSIVNIFDIGVLASFTEGISNAIMEYMAFGKPVVATVGGGTNELVLNNVTGFLIEQQDILQLARKIDLLLSNPELSQEMGLKGKERIFNHFTLNKMVEEFIHLYNKTIKEK